MKICRYCKQSQVRFKKLPKYMLQFVQWKLPKITGDDLFCEKCYMKLKRKHEQWKKFRSNQLASSIVTSTTEESLQTKSSLNWELSQDDLSKVTSSEDAFKPPSKVRTEKSPKSFESDFSISSEASSNENLSVRAPAIISKETNKNVTVRKKDHIPTKIIESNVSTSANSEVVLEEVVYDDSDDDIFDPGIVLPTVQPHVKKRTLVRSKGEPLNWTYKSGG